MFIHSIYYSICYSICYSLYSVTGIISYCQRSVTDIRPFTRPNNARMAMNHLDISLVINPIAVLNRSTTKKVSIRTENMINACANSILLLRLAGESLFCLLLDGLSECVLPSLCSALFVCLYLFDSIYFKFSFPH